MRGFRWIAAVLLGVIGGGAEPATASEPLEWYAAGPAAQGSLGEDETEEVDDVWRRLSRRSAERGSDLSPRELDELHAWVEQLASHQGLEAGAALHCLLCFLSPLERTTLISKWAISPNVRLRQALAASLSHPLEAVGRRMVIDHLVLDPDEGVRSRATRARAQVRARPGRPV